MNDPFEPMPRVWRQDRHALVAGVCAGLAEDLDLPLPLIRMLAVLFVLLPTGLSYLALALLLRRRLPAGGGVAGLSGWAPSRGSPDRSRSAAAFPASPASQNWELLRHRLATLEPRLKNIEAFVTSSDFELHRGFRRMER